MDGDEEENILKNRLIFKDTVIKRAFKKYLYFINTLTSPNDTPQQQQDTNNNNNINEPETSLEKTQSAYISLVKELSNFELGIQKATIISDTNRDELTYYDSIYKQREIDIENVKKEITQLRERLAYEKVQRQYKEQYLALYKLINEKPTIEQTEREISQAQKELNEISEQTSRTNSKLDLRSKQFQLLLHTLSELEKNLEEDDLQIKSSSSNKTMEIDSIIQTTATPPEQLETINNNPDQIMND
eukprot:gene11879-14530_t